MTVSDRLLMAAALGVLDPGDLATLGEALGPSEHLRQSGLAALAEVPLPNALPSPSFERGDRGVLHGSDGNSRVGDRVSFALRWPHLPPGARCAVFRRIDGEVRRLYPRTDVWTPLSRFRKRGGHPLLELVVEPPTGHQNLDVILISGELVRAPWPDGDPAWDRLHGAYLRGQGYGLTLEIDVV